jgi:hypothetical protein
VSGGAAGQRSGRGSTVGAASSASSRWAVGKTRGGGLPTNEEEGRWRQERSQRRRCGGGRTMAS